MANMNTLPHLTKGDLSSEEDSQMELMEEPTQHQPVIDLTCSESSLEEEPGEEKEESSVEYSGNVDSQDLADQSDEESQVSGTLPLYLTQMDGDSHMVGMLYPIFKSAGVKRKNPSSPYLPPRKIRKTQSAPAPLALLCCCCSAWQKNMGHSGFDQAP